VWETARGNTREMILWWISVWMTGAMPISLTEWSLALRWTHISTQNPRSLSLLFISGMYTCLSCSVTVIQWFFLFFKMCAVLIVNAKLFVAFNAALLCPFPQFYNEQGVTSILVTWNSPKHTFSVPELKGTVPSDWGVWILPKEKEKSHGVSS